MSAPRLGIGIIGAGRVGAVLGAALRAEGHAITGAYAVSDASRERAAALLPGVPLLDVEQIIGRSELVLLAVPDDQLAPLASGIAATGMVPGGQIIAHTSGRYGIEVLAPLERVGSAVLALHPAMTFTGTAVDLPRLIGCPLGISAREAFLPVAEALAVEIGAEPVLIAEGDRALYHAALAHGANHLVVLVDQSMSLLSRIGLADPGAYLRPLLSAALDEALRRGAGALTGPVRRGDAGTVAAHLDALAEAEGDPGDVIDAYRVLARAALHGVTLPTRQAEHLRALLENPAAHGELGPHEDPAPHENPNEENPA